jgi:bacterioferritin (cytochrome b1)
MEDRHAEMLRLRLLALGGLPQAVEAPAVVGGNQWERAVAALHGAQTKRRRLIEQISHWDPEEPEMVTLLRQIEQEDQSQQLVYEALIMRSDPQSID